MYYDAKYFVSDAKFNKKSVTFAQKYPEKD